MIISAVISPPRSRSPEATVPYSDEALAQALDRVCDKWREASRQHDRLAIYKYLRAVFDLAMVWKKEKDEQNRAKRALELAKSNLSVVEPFAAIIACTSPKKHVDVKTRSKWARVLRFAAEFKTPAVSLTWFIR